jgi:hypothetical protein
MKHFHAMLTHTYNVNFQAMTEVPSEWLETIVGPDGAGELPSNLSEVTMLPNCAREVPFSCQP